MGPKRRSVRTDLAARAVLWVIVFGIAFVGVKLTLGK